MSPRHRSPEYRVDVLSAVLAVVGLVLLGLGLLGVSRSAFLVEDLAYFGTGGLGGVVCLILAAIFRVSAASAARCRGLDEIEAGLGRPAHRPGLDEHVDLPAEEADPAARMGETGARFDSMV